MGEKNTFCVLSYPACFGGKKKNPSSYDHFGIWKGQEIDLGLST